MTRSWKMLAFYSLFASAFSQAPALAGEKDKVLEGIKTTVDGIADDVKSIKKSMEAVKKDVEKLQGDFTLLSAHVDGHKSKIEAMDKQIKDLQRMVGLLSNSPANGLEKAGLDDIKKTLGSIEQAILRLQPGEKRVAFSAPGATTAGRVILANLYGERLLFTINGKNYVVEANTTLPIEGVPAGNLTYEVRSPTWGLRAQAAANLKAEETFTLTAR